MRNGSRFQNSQYPEAVNNNGRGVGGGSVIRL
jgi:hypothetical protein